MEKIHKEQYDEMFGIKPAKPELLEAALDHARENRKFEIELYWKRATYFWTLIAATFAGHFATLTAKDDASNGLVAFVLACIGLVFTYAWHRADRGSKQWQENWEAHVDLLENAFTGPLYKTVLRQSKTADAIPLVAASESASRQEKLRAWIDGMTGASDVSVSRVNQIVNLFTLCVWVGLVLHAATLAPRWSVAVFGILTIAFIAMIRVGGRTNRKDQMLDAEQRTTKLND